MSDTMSLVDQGNLIDPGSPHGSYSGVIPQQGTRWPKLAEEIIKRQKRLESIRESQDAVWDLIDTYVTARRANFDIGSRKGAGSAGPGGDRIFDGTATLALHDFADGWQANTANAMVKWWGAKFRSKEAQKDFLVKRWLDEVEEAVSFELAQSNFYEQLNLCYQDITTHIATMSGPQWDDETNQLWFVENHPREIFFWVDWRGRPAGWHRKFLMSGRQIIEEFGEQAVPQSMREQVKANPFLNFTCIHAIFKREERDVRSPLSTDKPWASVYVLEQSKSVIHEGGYDKIALPDTAAWESDVTMPYGSNPAISTLYDVATTNEAMRTMINAAQLAVDPALILTEGMKGRVNIFPAGQTIVKGAQDKVEAFQFPQQFNIGVQMLTDLRAELREKFKANLFTMQADMGKLTAYQSQMIQGEKASMLIMPTSRASSKMLVPKINKSFYALAKARRLPPPPPSAMQYIQSPVDIEMMGPMAISAKRFLGTQGFQALLGMLEETEKVFAPLAQSILEGFDADQIRDLLMTASGVSSKIEIDDKKLAMIRQMKAKMMQQQQQQQAIGNLAEAYHKATNAPEPGSPAQSLMGGGQ